MKCARVHLQERSKPVVKRVSTSGKPRRYCQKRMINPEHCEDPRWTDVLQRFHCNPTICLEDSNASENTSVQPEEDLFLTVQNLQFQGIVPEIQRPRISFKYKSHKDNIRHRMFVKQTVDDINTSEEDISSELTNYYFDDYVKYILNTDRSRPSSSKSSIFLHDLTNKFQESKSIPVDNKQTTNAKKCRQIEVRVKSIPKKSTKQKSNEVIENNMTEDDILDDTKVAYQNTGKRKSLTISRVPSPETYQVIRVDVVCNQHSNSVMSDYEDTKKQKSNAESLIDKEIESVKFKGPHFADKYILTNTIKSVNENLSCGSKVTLLCKTFKLSARSNQPESKFPKAIKDRPKTKKVK